MPLFRRGTPQDQEQQEAAARDAAVQQQSLAQLQAGGLPVRAQERIAQIRSGAQQGFSSDLSPAEALLLRESGYYPLGLVAGSSVYHSGWNRWTMTGELDAQTNALSGAAYAAIGRLEQEALGMGALGVAGVRFEVRRPSWGESLVEVVVLGTALRGAQSVRHERPFISGLSGQELWSLLRAGVRPAGLVFGNSAFYIYSGWSAQMQTMSWFNQEVMIYSAGLHEAQRLAFGRMHEHARQYGAHGVMGVHIEHSLERIELEGQNDVKRNDYIVEYMSWGTAVIEAPTTTPMPRPILVKDLEDRARTGRVTQGSAGGK
jgi:uncharacterized protein YbjQ (UPF0145 family)